MKIWVDADACPGVIKEILFRAAERTGIPLTLVANHQMKVPRGQNISFILVPPGFDVADNEIVRNLRPGDLVITADIPLAAEVISNHGQALNPRGELYTPENIRERLNMRDFFDTLRAVGIESGGPAAFSKKDRQYFAGQLDKLLAQHQQKRSSSL
jgi:uncharacterized protein YaiI (UPF0178 family)